MIKVSWLLLALLSSAWSAVQAQTQTPDEAETVELPSVVFESDLPDTLMFTIDELNEIQTRRSGGETTSLQYRSGAIEDANLFLSTIVFFSAEEWSFWLNGVRVAPGIRFDTFDVVNVAPDHIEIIVPLSAAGVRPVRIEPNQTFIGDNGRVVEGAFN